MESTSFQSSVDNVTHLLAQYDFMGLIKIGCPKDEYSGEAKMFIEELSIYNFNYKDLLNLSIHKICYLLANIFNDQFGLNNFDYAIPFRQEEIINIALDIKEYIISGKIYFDCKSSSL